MMIIYDFYIYVHRHQHAGLLNACSVCSEIGRREREEREAFRQLQEQGYKVKQEYIQQGKHTKDEKRVRVASC